MGRSQQSKLSAESFVNPKTELVRLHAALRGAVSEKDCERAVDVLGALAKVPRVTEAILRASGGVARCVGKLRRHEDPTVASAALELTQQWKAAIMSRSDKTAETSEKLVAQVRRAGEWTPSPWPTASDARRPSRATRPTTRPTGERPPVKVVDCRPDPKNLVTAAKVRTFFAPQKPRERGATEDEPEVEWDG